MQTTTALEQLRDILDQLERRPVAEVASDLRGGEHTDHAHAYVLGCVQATARAALAQLDTD